MVAMREDLDVTPDAYIRLYYSRRDDVGAASFNFVQSEGYVFAGACEKCNKRRRKQTPTLEWVCANRRCQTNGAATPWPFKPAFIPRGVVQSSPRPGHGELRMYPYLGVARELACFLDDEGTRGHIYVAAALGMGRREIAEQGSSIWPGDKFPWSEWNVREAIREGREKWTERLKRIRLA